MSLINLDLSNSITTNYPIPNNLLENKTDTIEVTNKLNNTDQVVFSIDYSNNEVSAILNKIKTSFDDQKSVNKDPSLIEYTTSYSELLKNINSNTNFDDSTKAKLTTILDSSYDSSATKKAQEITHEAANFFNAAYRAKQIYDKEKAPLGVQGINLYNEEDAQKTITNMLLGAKTFYKNNTVADEEQLETFLQNSFSETTSIEKLGYKDFKLLQNSLDILHNEKSYEANSIAEHNVVRETLSTKAIEYLKDQDASSILTDTFERASLQNNRYHKRIEIYGKIRYEYEKLLENLGLDRANKEAMLEELKKKRQNMIEEYNKEMEKLKRDSHKLYLLNNMLGKNDVKYDPMETLTKNHDEQLKLNEKQQNELQENLTTMKEYIKETAEKYEKFMKNPAETIDAYFE
ncbi:hypothetical protein [Clostridium cellulovorans]|uniref:Uncharacterized protein n=1 Tax=Clostridium cellulovorans (strain ATCC 35296 / DSM 3052 / OCM 3 / 743B) TaxID=573061 RepID=D9SRW1_CLOC7|nr:hypothetical protein [Clostridium cellulovorans]ADL50478.1 hypothetical protein Clocel_0707 [Clostridium cellulovorans 743B]